MHVHARRDDTSAVPVLQVWSKRIRKHLTTTLHCGETNSFDGRGAVDGANRVDGIPLEEPIVGEPASFQRVVLWHSSLETELRPQSA